jgi:hypothetical protein
MSRIHEKTFLSFEMFGLKVYSHLILNLLIKNRG